MNLIFITPKVLPSGHSRYGLIDLDAETFTFDDDLNQIIYEPRQPFEEFTGAWDFDLDSTLSELISHPDVITFTRDSHPEYFL